MENRRTLEWIHGDLKRDATLKEIWSNPRRDAEYLRRDRDELLNG